MKNIPYGKHFIDEDDIQAVVDVLKSSNLTQGPIVDKYEQSFAKYVGAKYAVSVSSCSAGLHISSIALGLSKSDKFITSPITFVSTVSAGLHLGSKPIFCDVDKQTINISIEKLEEILKKQQIKIVIPVHFGGLACEMKKIKNLSYKYGFKILEDAAHALGSKYQNGKYVGSCIYSDLCVFSTHPVKTIATAEGGMITTNNKNLYTRLLRLRSHGINKNNEIFSDRAEAYTNGKRNLWYYEMHELGYHYRLNDIQSALGITQLKKINKFLKSRDQVVQKYRKKLSKNICTPAQPYTKYSSNHLYVVRLKLDNLKKNKNQIMMELRKKNIITQVHYIPIPLHLYFKNKGYKTKNIENAIEYFNHALSLPCYYSLSDKDLSHVINSVHEIYKI